MYPYLVTVRLPQSVSIPGSSRPRNIHINYWHINISTMPSLKISYEVGLDFLEFLGQRISKTDRNELRDIYNLEFKRFATMTQTHLLSVWHICFEIHSCQVLFYFVFVSKKFGIKLCVICIQLLCVISLFWFSMALFLHWCNSLVSPG